MTSKTKSAPGSRPAAAVELTAEGVLAASLPAHGAAPVYAWAPLAAGSLEPALSDSNLHAPEAVAKAIATALDEADPRTRVVTLLVPDVCVRVFVLDFDSLPAKAAEAVPVIRFRLRRLLPFEAEHAGISYQILTQTKDECRALIAVLPGPLLSEYEAAVRAAGYEPGVVLPSGLAALAAVAAPEPTLVACLGTHALTTAITHGDDLLLYRTLELPASDAARIAEIQRDIAVAQAFFEDELGRRPDSLLYSGVEDAAEFARRLADPALTLRELAPRPTTGAATTLGRLNFAGIAGALTGAA